MPVMGKGWTILKSDGSKSDIVSDKAPTLDEIQKAVGGYYEVLRQHSTPKPIEYQGRKVQVAMNEEGRMNGLPVNVEASEAFGLEIVGDVMIVFGFRIG